MPDEIDPQRPYGRSDPVFTRDLALGWEAELYVRAKLDEAGVPDVVPGCRWRSVRRLLSRSASPTVAST